MIIEHYPLDQLSYSFHIIKNNQLGENLLLHVYYKFAYFSISLHTNSLFYRLQSIITGTYQDHCLLSERLFEIHSWKMAILTLCNTNNVNISNALIYSIAYDPHVVLRNNISPLSNLSIGFVLIFYGLATNIQCLTEIRCQMLCIWNYLKEDEI